jgi:hypothetical protein
MTDVYSKRFTKCPGSKQEIERARKLASVSQNRVQCLDCREWRLTTYDQGVYRFRVHFRDNLKLMLAQKKEAR